MKYIVLLIVVMSVAGIAYLASGSDSSRNPVVGLDVRERVDGGFDYFIMMSNGDIYVRRSPKGKMALDAETAAYLGNAFKKPE